MENVSTQIPISKLFTKFFPRHFLESSVRMRKLIQQNYAVLVDSAVRFSLVHSTRGLLSFRPGYLSLSFAAGDWGGDLVSGLGHSNILKQGIALKVRSDWLLKLRISLC